MTTVTIPERIMINEDVTIGYGAVQFDFRWQRDPHLKKLWVPYKLA